MSFLKKTGVFIISIASIILIILISMSLTLNSFLYPQIYFKAFEVSGLYESIESNLQNAQDATFIKIPEEGPRPLVESLLSNLLSYMRSDTDDLTLEVKIDKDKLRNFFLDSINKTQECKKGQDPFGENPCIPKGESPEQFLNEFLKERNFSFFEKDTVDLTTVYGIDPGSQGRKNLDNIRYYIGYYKYSIVILISLLIIFTSLLYLLEKPRTRKFLRVLGIVLIIPSLIILLMITSINNLKLLSNINDPLVTSMISTVKSVLTDKFRIFFYSTLILGLVSIISSFFIIEKTTNNLKSKIKPKK